MPEESRMDRLERLLVEEREARHEHIRTLELRLQAVETQATFDRKQLLDYMAIFADQTLDFRLERRALLAAQIEIAEMQKKTEAALQQLSLKSSETEDKLNALIDLFDRHRNEPPHGSVQ